MAKKMLCRIILTPVTESEEGLLEGGFTSLNGAEFIGELEARNGDCKNGTCPNGDCKNGFCTNGDCANGYCQNKDCKNGDCPNPDCTNGYCTVTPTPTSTSTSTSTATGTSHKIGSLAVDGLV